MLPSKRAVISCWAGRLGCLVLAGALALPQVALARDSRSDRDQDSQPGRGHGSQTGQGHKPQVAPRLPKGHQEYVYGRGHNSQVVPRLPRSHQEYAYQGTRYYGHGGVYYRPSGHGYVVSRPPRGMFIRGGLPLGFATLVVAGLTYYTLAGIFYRPAPNGYVVVDAPAGVVVNSPPAQIVAPSQPQGTAVVTAPLLNVRSGPGRNYPVMTAVPQGVNLAIYGQSSGWLYVQAPNGQFGWVAQRFTNMQAATIPNG